MPTTKSQLTTPSRTVEAADGVTYAYRRFGRADRGALPLEPSRADRSRRGRPRRGRTPYLADG